MNVLTHCNMIYHVAKCRLIVSNVSIDSGLLTWVIYNESCILLPTYIRCLKSINLATLNVSLNLQVYDRYIVNFHWRNSMAGEFSSSLFKLIIMSTMFKYSNFHSIVSWRVWQEICKTFLRTFKSLVVRVYEYGRSV